MSHLKVRLLRSSFLDSDLVEAGVELVDSDTPGAVLTSRVAMIATAAAVANTQAKKTVRVYFISIFLELREPFQQQVGVGVVRTASKTPVRRRLDGAGRLLQMQ